jgi:hypothetical protein
MSGRTAASFGPGGRIRGYLKMATSASYHFLPDSHSAILHSMPLNFLQAIHVLRTLGTKVYTIELTILYCRTYYSLY